MGRLKLDDLRRLHELLRGAYAIQDLDALVAYIVAALPKVVPSDFTVYGELNHGRRRYKWLWDPPQALFPGAEETFKRHAREHPFFERPRGGGDGSARKLSDLVTQRDFHRRGIYNEVFRRIGIEHEMIVWLPGPRALEVNIAAHRARKDFSEAERLLLDLLRPHLIQAYQNAEAVTGMWQERLLFEHALETNSQGALLLAPDGRVSYVDDRARGWITRYFGKMPGRGTRLPEALAQWVRHQDGLLAPTDDAPAARAPLLVEQDGKRLLVRLLSEPTRRLLLFEERSGLTDPRCLQSLGLTAREAEVLTWVAQGKTNEVIGRIFGTSPRTVEKHLENILRKLGVETRTAAAARAFEVAGGPEGRRGTGHRNSNGGAQ